jgi:hypothetical protein
MWRLLRRLPRPLRPVTCLDCGFLGYRETRPEEGQPRPTTHEALAWVRRTLMLHADRPGQRIDPGEWFQSEDPAFCSKYLWAVERDDATLNIMLTQAALVSRRRCRGFYRWEPGRTPQEHIELQDKSRERRWQMMIALVAFLGALVGAFLPAVVAWVRGQSALW